MMTKKVVVLSETAPKRPLPSDVCAVVAHAMHDDDAELLASTIGVRVQEADHVFHFRRGTVRPTSVQDAVRYAGRAVYRPISPGRVVTPCAQGTSPTLYTAFLLAHVLGADTIEWQRSDDCPVVPQQSPAFMKYMESQGISVVVE